MPSHRRSPRGWWRGILFAYCPFAFARQAHSQLLPIGFLPWSMLAFHRLLDCTTMLAIELGWCWWVTGLAVPTTACSPAAWSPSASIPSGSTRRRWQESEILGRPGSRRRALHRALSLPLFLPYLEMQEATGFSRSLNDSRRYSANIGGWLDASAWAHAWWFPYLQRPYFSQDSVEGLFPGIVTVVFGGWGAGLGAAQVLRHACYYGYHRLDRVLGDLRPEGGPSTRCPSTPPFPCSPSCARLRARASSSRRARPVLAATAMSQLIRGRQAAFALLLVLAIAYLFRAPLRMRERRRLRWTPNTLARLPRGPVFEVLYWYEWGRIPACGRHARRRRRTGSR